MDVNLLASLRFSSGDHGRVGRADFLGEGSHRKLFPKIGAQLGDNDRPAYEWLV